MRQDPIEVVTSIYETWNAGDWALDHFHPTVEWEWPGERPLDEAESSRGRDALFAYWRRFWAAWRPGAQWKIEELQRMGNEQVLACGQLHVLGRSSGIETSIPVFHVWTVREGVVVQLLICDDRESALRAADS
jgi:ketosteroid isomerase-like protein